ncbi:MAG: hypothetical protein IJD10_06895 [Clostridia bacterium]|nr:hypothetical protein [Clostridia bacterium]
MKRILLFVLVILCLVGGTACSEKNLEISEEEALRVMTELVPLSHELNVIFFGEGLPVTEPPAERPTATTYLPVSADSPYSSIAAIKTAAEKVYSSRYLEGIYVAAFVGVIPESDDGSVNTLVSPRYQEFGSGLQADVSVAPKPNMLGKLTVQSVKVGRATPTYIAVETTCLDEGGNTVVKTILLTIENGVWLLDSPTY